MDTNRKHLRDLSGLVLFLALLAAIGLVSDALALDFNIQNLPDYVSAGIASFMRIFLCAFGFILLLPQIYVGVRGLKIAKNPTTSKGHIVWAIILTVCTVMSIPSPISDIAQGVQVGANIMELFRLAIDILLYVTYVVCAKRVLNDAK